MASGRRRRRCHYRNCDHQSGPMDGNVRPEGCYFRAIPKDPVNARLWLSLGSITHLTPKKLTAHNCFICSCHFHDGSTLPDEYVEEYDDDVSEDIPEIPANTKRPFQRSADKSASDSPMAKTSRVDEVSTPRTRLAIVALLSLQAMAEQSIPAQKSTTPRTSVTYSPRNRLWLERGSSVRKQTRRRLGLLVESCSISQIETIGGSPKQNLAHEDRDDLGVMPLNMCSTPLHSPSKKHGVFDSGIETPSTLQSSLQREAATPSFFRSPMTEEVSNFIDQENIIINYPDTPDDKETQTEAKLYRCQEIQCKRSFLCYLDARENLTWDQFKFYTGLTKTMFEVFYTFLGGDEVCGSLKYKYNDKTPKREQFTGDLFPKDKLFMALLRLRRGIPVKDLGVLFNVHRSWAARVVCVWVRFMSLQFKLLESSMFPTADAQNSLKPKCYEKFPKLRGIIDSTEFKIQRPKHMQQQSNTYSTYKGANTMKALVCLSCHGGLSYISEGFEGSISDRKLLIESGLLDKMLPEEALMADRGFDAEDLFDERDLELIMPAFLGNRETFTARELIRNRAIAVSRIHVETFIGMIKQFRLVRYIIPNSMLAYASDLIKVCAFLANFQLPYIKNDTDDNYNN